MESPDTADRALLERKVRKAFQVLILQRGRNPGVKGWEMKRYLGRDYRKILEVLGEDVSAMGLEVFEVKGADGTDDSTRFLLRFRDPPSVSEAETSGIRIDDLAVLAATIAFVNSKQGRVARREVEQFLKEKFPRWRVDYSLDRYVKRGYLEQDERTMLHIGWRTRAEVDEKTLMTMILSRAQEVAKK
ncbi:MAG TPA: hypothetical protein VEB67_01815 [Nitrososphaerales archaeon]|nr:hypothetical protein [Nitrososphaerales archaeon]